MDFIEGLKAKAREGKARIVLPEGLEERTLKAADVILAEGFAEIILIGNPDDIKSRLLHLTSGILIRLKLLIQTTTKNLRLIPSFCMNCVRTKA